MLARRIFIIIGLAILLTSCGRSNREDITQVGTEEGQYPEVSNGAITRYEAAHYIADKLNVMDYDKRVSDVSSSDARTLAILSRDIFGSFNEKYKFNGDRAFTKYDMAKVLLNTYAYLECVHEENLKPGEKLKVNDLDDYSPLQQWYVFSALDYGFVNLKDKALYGPMDAVRANELSQGLDKVISLSKNNPLDLEEFKRKRLENYRACPSLGVPVEKTLDYYYANNNRYERLLAISLEGLANRNSVQIIVEKEHDIERRNFIYEYAFKRGYLNKERYEYYDVYELLAKYAYKYNFNKFVVYNSNKLYQLNLATDICSVEGRLMISENQVDKIKELIENPDFLYIDSLGIDNQYEATMYSYKNYAQFLRRDIIGMSYHGNQQDPGRDYNIQMKLPNYWVPGKNSPDYNSKTLIEVCKIMSQYPANIPLLGFSYAYELIDGIGTNVGIGEFTGVDLFGQYGKFMYVYDSVGNLSVFTNLKPADELLEFKRADRSYKPYDRNKKYVAITMQESGDSPAYIQNTLYQFQWNNEAREHIKYNYSYSLAAIDLLPLHTEYFMQTKTDNDYLYGAISGIGYCYPLATFGTKPLINDNGIYTNREEIMQEHYSRANELMKRLGFEAMAVYGYSNAKWSEVDYDTFDKYALKNLTECKYVLADMHRPVGVANALPVHLGKFGQRYYHCNTFWSLENLGRPNSLEYDDKAIDYLVKEIVNNTKNGQFFQCMAYSWHYGPRRVKMVMDKINELYPNQYEFVNIDELDHYYLESK